MQCVVVAALLGPPSPPHPMVSPLPLWFPVVWVPPYPSPLWLRLAAPLCSTAHDSDEYYGDDDDEDGVMIPIRTLLRSLAQESRMKIIQTRAQAYL